MGNGSTPVRSDWAPRANPSVYPVGSVTPVVDSSGVSTEQVRLALRVVVLLARSGPLEPGAVGRPESTQLGMAAHLGVTQGAVSKVLRRLAAAGAIRHERHHVRGVDRRVQAYSLTDRGADLARRYLERFPTPDPPP